MRRSDSDLIEESLSDPKAFAAVFERHFTIVHRYLSRRVGTELADDLAAETFARAFENRERFDRTRHDARPWLLGISTNLLRHHFRAEANQLTAYARHATTEDVSFDPHLDESAAVALAIPLVAKALRALRGEDRDVLLLVGWADLTYAQTAEALGLPIGTVRSRLRRARSSMQRALQGREEIRGMKVVWAREGDVGP